MNLNWVTLSVLNAAYSTLVLGGILWFKMHRLRLEVRLDYAAVQAQLEPMTISSRFLREHLERIEAAQEAQDAQLSEIERSCARMGQWMERYDARGV